VCVHTSFLSSPLSSLSLSLSLSLLLFRAVLARRARSEHFCPDSEHGNKTKTGGEHILTSQLKILYIHYGVGMAGRATRSPGANVPWLAKVYDASVKRMLIFLRRSSCVRYNDHNARERAIRVLLCSRASDLFRPSRDARGSDSYV
jgi:hypothetical protein